MTKQRTNLLQLTLCALFVGLISICAWVTIPATVPFTLQTLGVFTALTLLGGKRGTCAIAGYLLLGCIGLPVFSGFSGGIGSLLGMTGGYLFGFLLTGLIYWGITALGGETVWAKALGLVLGLAACYAVGTAWFLLVYTRRVGEIGLWGALGMCVLPFVLPDLLKAALACLLARRLERYLPK